MSAGRALPVKAPAQKEPASVGSQRARKRADDGERMEPVPPPLPADPAERAELFARLDRSIASAQAGRLVDWEDVDRRTRQKLGLPPA
ncbi:MAG: hypothetical protein JNM83_09220 [Myxococcales bacterium]|jgi:hypothetical protein|nr:hypothetical protein [Myxococcales bacterium]